LFKGGPQLVGLTHWFNKLKVEILAAPNQIAQNQQKLISKKHAFIL